MTAPVMLQPPVRDIDAGSACDLSIVVPAFNEELRLRPTIDALLAHLDRTGIDGEVVVVDDGSRDATAEVARSVGDPRARLLGYPRNRGKGYAVKTGVLGARGRRILVSDADLSTPIEELERLETALRNGAEVAIGSRHLRESRILIRQPFHRRYLGRVFNAVVSVLGLRGISDTQCGFKLFRREAARAIFLRVRTDGFAFDVEALVRARESGFKVAEIPVRWINNSASRVRPVRDGFRMILELLRMKGLVP